MSELRIKSEFSNGYNDIANGEKHPEYLMDFGVLAMKENDTYSNNEKKERAFLLMQGKVEFSWDGKSETVYRENVRDSGPICLHVPNNVEVNITGLSNDVEIAVHHTENEKIFPSKLYQEGDYRMEVRGKGVMDEVGKREVRTIIDHSINPDANLMLGEDMQAPGKWAGFPSHHHAQPEIYFYKLYPEEGFGLLKLGDDAELLEHNDTVLIPPHLDHPQVPAPGYAMYFLWVIRHLEGNPYIKPTFVEEHLWAEKEDAKYWDYND